MGGWWSGRRIRQSMIRLVLITRTRSYPIPNRLRTSIGCSVLRSFSTSSNEEKHSHPPQAKPNNNSSHLLSRKRVQGFGRKITLRAINRNVVRRLAKRATIGIPLIGMYFALRVLKNDITQSSNLQNAPFIRNTYKLASVIDVSDVAAQCVIIASMVSTFFLQDSFAVPAALADLVPIADKVSLAAALTSSVLGTYCEIKKEEMEEEKEL